ncbi:MAG: hypothetical protein IKP73_14245 [Bacteroidales bacterium]|jgi:hypothetical protein|nr:hypothetical protein [Bacteroidales bacterium]
MAKLRAIVILMAVIMTSATDLWAQCNISAAFTGFGLDFGKGYNVPIYKNTISDGKNPIFEPGIRLGVEVYATPATSLKAVQTFRYDVMAKLAMSTQVMLRFRIFKVYKHSVSLGVGPTFFYRRSWSGEDGYVEDDVYDDGALQRKIAWLSTELEYNYVVGRYTDVSFALTHMNPQGIGCAVGIKYWFTRKSNKCGTCPSFD